LHLNYSRKTLKKLVLALQFTLVAVPAMPAATPDVTAPIHQFIDGFNAGDTKPAYAAYATGDITIVDEFAPHRWIGPQSRSGLGRGLRQACAGYACFGRDGEVRSTHAHRD
jgi:hypothetical protein